MPLLLHASSARAGTPLGDGFLPLLGALGAHFPDTLLLPISAEPPGAQLASPNVDWLTLPRGSRRAVRTRLLRAYAEWFRPRASLFFGDDVEPYLAAAGAALGRCFVVTEAPAPAPDGVEVLPPERDALVAALRPLLPLTFVLDRDGELARLEAALSAPIESPELSFYLGGTLREQDVAAVERASRAFSGSIVVQLRLLQGLARHPRAFASLKLLRSLGPKVSVRVISERALGARIADGLTAVNRLSSSSD